MEDLFVVFLALHLPVLIVCGVFYVAGHRVTHRKTGIWLRISALAWLAMLWSIFTGIIVAMETCSGNMLYGYHQCSVLPDSVADASLLAFVFGVGGAILYGVVLMVAASVAEYRHRSALARA